MSKVQDAINNLCQYTVPLDGEVVGSSTIKGLTPRDYDVLIWMGHIDRGKLRKAGLVPLGEEKEYDLQEGFEVWHDHSRNTDFIITPCKELYDKFKDANELCVKLNLKKRDDRIQIFQYVVYGNML